LSAATKPTRVLFVCTGNICRSPTAEGVLRRDRPVLLFECEQRHMPGSSPTAIFGYLQGLGYRGWYFGPAGLAPVEQFRADIHQPVRAGRYWNAKDYYNNFAFLPESATK